MVLGAVSFAPALRAPFLGADLRYVERNREIHDLRHIPSFFGTQYWNRPEAGADRAVSADRGTHLRPRLRRLGEHARRASA